jgi:2-iminobutanoate/2-iminopropanoate deaminase
MKGSKDMPVDTQNPRKRAIVSPDAPSGTGPYSAALAAGNFVFVSGQGPLDPKTHEIMGTGIEEQTKLTFSNVDALLKAAGASLRDVVKVNVYLSDMDDYPSFNAIYGRLFEQPYPVRTTVACGLQGILIEVDCIAMMPTPG